MHSDKNFLNGEKDLMWVNGRNVDPHEIEDILLKHPKVSEAFVTDVGNEQIGAFLVLCKGETASLNEFLEFCRVYLFEYARPVFIEFLAELPRDSKGSILKKSLNLKYEIIH